MYVSFVDILANKFSESIDQSLNIGKYLVFFVLLQLFQHVLLSYGVASQQVGNRACQNGICQLDVDSYVLLQQIHNEFAQVPLL